jgi:hypothetical protein
MPILLRDCISGKFHDGTVRRFVFFATVAFWLGGFTFYSGVVIHVGIRVLGSHLRQGLITQQVTNWLNLIGAIALPIMLWNTASIWSSRGPVARFFLAATWLAMAAVQVELFALHPLLDRLLDAPARAILDYDRFDTLHRLYLLSATLQWGVGVVHVWWAVSGTQI